MSSNKLITLDKKRNNLSLLFEICEKIFDNNLLKYKYIFIDILLNEWYSINKTLITEKINNLENINSIYVYNCHKYLIYTILTIANKYKTKTYFQFFYIYNKNIFNKKIIFIKRIFLNDFIIKHKEKYESESGLKCSKDLFFYYLINNNINNIQKENSIINRYIINKKNYNKDKFGKINLFIALNKWGLISSKYKYNNIENIFIFYFDKIKFFQCKAFIYVYKRKLRNIYNIFINKIINKRDIYFIKKNKLRNTSLLLSIFNPINDYIINNKIFFFRNIYLYYYLLKKVYFFYYIIFYFINNIINKYKKRFMKNLKIYINKKRNNYILSLHFIRNFIYFKKYKILLFSFNQIKNSIQYKSNKKFNTNKNSKNIRINKELINIINIYYKYHNFNNWKKRQILITYFNNWKTISKLNQYKKITQYNNKLKKKLEKYNNKNIIIKNKIEILKQKNKKKKIDINIKETINNNNIKKNEKIIISKDITKIIKQNNTNSENDGKNDENNNLKFVYLNDLENLKNKNESIIVELQAQINSLVKEIETLSFEI